MEVFRVEKRKFDMEVSKWDDNGNDIIVLAKHMCLIMMEMTDFTRGKGIFVFSKIQYYFFEFYDFNHIRLTGTDLVQISEIE